VRPIASALIAALLVGTGLGSPIALLSPERSGAQPAAADEAAQYEVWTARLDAARTRLKHARAAVAEGDAAYSKNRQRHRLRGETNTEVISGREAAERELAAAEAAWPERLEQARRAGVPPGILRPYEDSFQD